MIRVVRSLPEFTRLDVSTGPWRAFSITYDADERPIQTEAPSDVTPEDQAMVAWEYVSRMQICDECILAALFVRAHII